MKIHLKVQGKTYTVKVGDIQSRPIRADVDGEIFEVWPEEMIVAGEGSSLEPTPSPVLPQSAAVKPFSDPKPAGQHRDAVLAPIPGVLTAISVQPGDVVSYGQELCELEAMKMKNSIRASQDGIIKAIHAKIGEHVEQSQLLIEFEAEGRL